MTTYSASRHSTSSTTSGQNNADKVCNIYDLEGNYFEYTAERNSKSGASYFTQFRGGGAGTGEFGKLPASSRRGYNGEAYGLSNTFRIVLYVM